MSDSSYEKQKRIALKNLMLENTQLITEARMRKNASPNTLGREHKVVSTVLTKRQADFVKHIAVTRGISVAAYLRMLVQVDMNIKKLQSMK